MTSSTPASHSSRRLQTVLVLVCLLALTGVTGIIVACSNGNSTATSGMAEVKTTISDPATCAAPDGPYSAVWVTITDVQASTSATAGATDSSWVDLTPNLSKNNDAVQVNLLGAADNQCFLASLGDNMELQAGSYQQIRLILAQTTAGLTLSSGTSTSMNSTDMCQGSGAANCVVMGTGNNAQTYPLQLSSEAQTGLKIPSGQIAGGAFTISAGQTKDLNVDFNTCSSIVQEGNGQFRLKPVLHAGEASTTSVSLNGTVVDSTGTAVANAMVAVEQQDSSTPSVDRIVQVAKTGSDGTWVICPLAGDPRRPYDIVVVGTDSTGILQSPVVITGLSGGQAIGKITLSLPTTGLTTPLTATTATANLAGQVDTTSATSAGISMDVATSVLEQVNGQIYTIPLPYTQTATVMQTEGSAWLNLQTAGNQTPVCKNSNNFCANYNVLLPVTAAFYGSWSGSSFSLTAPATAYASYVIDGVASGASDSSITPAGTTGCSPNEMQSAAVALTGSTTYPAAVAELDFTSCQ
ncbi:MAG TPA: DUF4382 domain-containing protein [Terracidiphilus sp.]|nr:DUF4382 domain-containing protein [Terracidiphilus sp.]